MFNPFTSRECYLSWRGHLEDGLLRPEVQFLEQSFPHSRLLSQMAQTAQLDKCGLKITGSADFGHVDVTVPPRSAIRVEGKEKEHKHPEPESVAEDPEEYDDQDDCGYHDGDEEEFEEQQEQDELEQGILEFLDRHRKLTDHLKCPCDFHSISFLQLLTLCAEVGGPKVAPPPSPPNSTVELLPSLAGIRSGWSPGNRNQVPTSQETSVEAKVKSVSVWPQASKLLMGSSGGVIGAGVPTSLSEGNWSLTSPPA